MPFLHRVADGIARGHARLAQEQRCGGGEILAMAGAGMEEEARQGRLVGGGAKGVVAPGGVSKFAGEEAGHALHGFRCAQAVAQAEVIGHLRDGRLGVFVGPQVFDGRRGIEGGAGIAGQFVDAGLVNKVTFFVAAKLVGGTSAPSAIGGMGVEKMADALELERVQVTQRGKDLEISGYPRYTKG